MWPAVSGCTLLILGVCSCSKWDYITASTQLNSHCTQHTHTIAGTEFKFVEPFGVTYWAHAARAWITHGSFTAPLGLTATLMYGFASPDGGAWVIAGSVPGVVSDVAASGAWTGYLFGLVQV